MVVAQSLSAFVPASPATLLWGGGTDRTPPILSDRSNAEGLLAPGSVGPQDGGEGKGPGTAAVLHRDPGAVTNRGRAEAGVQKDDRISTRQCFFFLGVDILTDRPPGVCPN